MIIISKTDLRQTCIESMYPYSRNKLQWNISPRKIISSIEIAKHKYFFVTKFRTITAGGKQRAGWGDVGSSAFNCNNVISSLKSPTGFF